LKKTLIIGFGNIDRQDDGVAWHVLLRIAQRLNRLASTNDEIEFELVGLNPELVYVLQLTPELAETIAGFERICFIDAHTGRIEQEFLLSPLQAGYQNSPFTHHMTPETLLSLASALYQKAPQAALASIRGHEFNFSRELSARTDQLADQAVNQIIKWLDE